MVRTGYWRSATPPVTIRVPMRRSGFCPPNNPARSRRHATVPPRGGSRTALFPRRRRSTRSVLGSSTSRGSTCRWREPGDWVKRSAVWPAFKRRQGCRPRSSCRCIAACERSHPASIRLALPFRSKWDRGWKAHDCSGSRRPVPAPAVFSSLPRSAPPARILHAHDWHAALAPVYLRTAHAGEPDYDRLGTVLSVHNAGFQGHFPPDTVADLGLAAELYDWRALEWFGQMNVLKGGLAFSDAVVTVSPSHARELRTPQGGFGLDDSFAALGDRLVGILNGIDCAVWNPQADPAIPAPYSPADLAGKRRCKAALQRAFGLAPTPLIPLVAMSARLVAQKGLDLILGGDLLSTRDAQFVFLGGGERRYEQALTDWAAAAPDRIAAQVTFTDRVEHELLAGADMLLMPSLYEPCGLTQMRAQLYGTIPVARRVGGLADTIEDGATGFLFDEYAPAALARVTRRAIERYAEGRSWERMMHVAMSQDFGWRRSAEGYVQVYGRALASRSARTRHSAEAP